MIVATGDVHNINREDRLYREIIVNQNVPGKGRHPLARYLNGSNKVCTNLDNIDRCIQKAQEQGVMLGDIEKKVLKYVYVLTKIKRIAITALNISYIYAVDKNNPAEDMFKGKEGEAEKLKAVSTALRKLTVAQIVREKEGEYVLSGS